ncbi:MarR family winged helix-turn-helix transcriptional regulator [Emcibacter sp.]|uniref:MarR family winged helix-turn-helix transcriptional regulator n=1 Tax=Emcibacter sp. TaxID=1979954 RepID=UPI003A93EE6E
MTAKKYSTEPSTEHRAENTNIENAVPENAEMFLETFVPYVMYRITNRLNKELQKDLRPLNINVSRWRVLAALNLRDGRTMGDLCTFTMIEQSSLSRVVDNMVDEGLVSRRLQKDDNRFVHVFLTDKGLARYREVYPQAFSRQDIILDDFSEEEQDQLLQFLHRIETNIRKHRN